MSSLTIWYGTDIQIPWSVGLHGTHLAFCRGAPVGAFALCPLWSIWSQLGLDWLNRAIAHGSIQTFCRGVLHWSLTRLFILTFCSGVNKFRDFCLHGTTLAFCRGALGVIFASNTHKFFWREISLVYLHRVIEHGCHQTFCRGVLCRISTLFFNLTFCSGVNHLQVTYICLHGTNLAFCRGAPTADSTLIYNQTFFTIGHFSSICRHSFAWAHTLFSYLAFCSGALRTRTGVLLHGFHSAFCRGAHWTTITFLQHWHHWNLTIIDIGTILWAATDIGLELLGALHLLALSSHVQPLFRDRRFSEQLHFYLDSAVHFPFLLLRTTNKWLTLRTQLLALQALPEGRQPGPKSGRSGVLKRFIFTWILMTQLNLDDNTQSGGEGRGFMSTEATEAPHEWMRALIAQAGAKPSGPQPLHRFGIQWPLDKVKKRSLRRAYKRAARDGTSWYRGKCYTVQDFPSQCPLERDAQPFIKPPPWQCQAASNRRQQKHRYIRYFTWNGGQLSRERLDELKLWLLGQNLDLVILTETHWKFQSEWTDDHWLYVHTGIPTQPGGGILIMVSKRLCPSHSLRWAEVVPGRMLHVQLRFPQRHMDILACYQYTYSANRLRMKERQEWWSSLDKYLGTLPRRHVLLLTGDFNCRLPAAIGITGPDKFEWNGSHVTGTIHPDEGQFSAIVKANHLSALNTWHPHRGPTFVQGKSCSRIDYCFTRVPLADGRSKDVQYLHSAPFLDCKHVGHVPLIGQLRKFWIPPVADDCTAGITSAQRDAGRLAFANNAAQWHQYLQDSRSRVDAFLHQVDPQDPTIFHQLHAVARDTFCAHFPVMKRVSTGSPFETNRTHIMNKWRHREACRKYTMPKFANFFRAWFHLARFQALKRIHKRHATLARQERVETIMHQAQQAADRHDTWKLFQVINRFCPKQPRIRVQIRNQFGAIATPVEEQSILHEFVSQTWNGPPHVPTKTRRLTGLPFTPDDLERALQAIPTSKAVARPFAPGLIWNAHASCLAQHVHRILTDLWVGKQPIIPQCWRDAWLILIPKPLRRPTSPDVLRPLALQEPIGKAIMGVLAQAAQKEAFAQMVLWPIWAYLPARGTQHALLRVAAHCKAGRNLVSSQRPSVMNRHHDLPVYTVCGAVQMFVDLRKAFDSVSRQELFGRLDEILAQPDLVQLLAQWHDSTSYHVETNGRTSPIPVGAGVRQGCKGAPFLFNAYVLLYLRDLSHLVDWMWLRDHVNIYADDMHASGLFFSEKDLQQLLFYFGLILEALQQKGMQVNTTKSAILLIMGGSNHRPVRTALTWRDRAGEWIKITGCHTEFVLPVTGHTKYLGTIVSYKSLEDQTIRHRLSLARVAFARMHSWLTAKRGLNVQSRLRLWQTCILPVLTYGLFTIGLTTSGIQQLQTAMTVMLRKIVHDHAYVTARSHSRALQFHQITPPLVLLWTAADTLHQSVTKTRYRLIPQDVCNLLDWTPVQDAKDLLQMALNSGLLPALRPMGNTEDVQPCIDCPYCPFVASDVPELRRHMTIAHAKTRYRRHVPDMHRFMIDGLPKCQLCQRVFTTWRSFQTHVQRGCQDPDFEARQARPLMPFPEDAGPDQALPGATAVKPLTKQEMDNVMQREFGPRLLTLIHQRNWHHLLLERAGCKFMAKHCLLCGQFVGRVQAMNQHFRTSHHAMTSLVQAKAAQLTNLHNETPCAACGVTFKSTHTCNVWFQVAMLIVHGPPLAATDLIQEVGPLTCDICGITCKDTQRLHAHLQTVHKLTAASWVESRDSLNGRAQCSHCLTEFQNLESLRSHINQGRCQSFDPDRTSEPKPLHQAWVDACCKGQMEEQLADAHARLQLTLHCQSCMKRYTRAADLACHLQSSHSTLWQAAQPLAFRMVQQYYAQMGCVCNPSCNAVRLHHVCLPFWQLAMQFARIPHGIFMPHKLTTTELARMLPSHIPADMRDTLHQALKRYDLQQIWTDSLLLDALSDSCFICGLSLLPAELCYHLQEAHDGMHEVVKSYVQQLHWHAMQHSDNDCACFACGQIINLPDLPGDDLQKQLRCRLVQAHLRTQCPSVLQLALLLAHALWSSQIGTWIHQRMRRIRCSRPSGALRRCWTEA